MDSGQWTVDSGQWTVDSGQWTVDSGQWAVDSGQWTVGSADLPTALLTAYCPLSTSLLTVHITVNCPLFLSTKKYVNRVALRIGRDYVDFSVPVHVADGEMPRAFARQKR